MRENRVQLLVLILSMIAMLAYVFVRSAGAQEPAQVHAPPPQLAAAIDRVLAEEGVPGVGVAVVDREGLRWAGGVGSADPASARPVEATTMFRTGSITKSFLAATIMALVERGEVRLDQPLSELDAGVVFDNAWSDTDPITLAHLLEHTAGFDDMRFNESSGPASVERLPLSEVLARNQGSRIARWRPGSRISYANPGYTVAAHVIEERTGAPYERSVQELLFDPLGMETSTLRRTAVSERRLAQGHTGADAPIPYWPIVHRPAGVLMSSPLELAAFVELLLNDGEVDGQALLRPASLDRIERTSTLPHSALDVNYGLGNYGHVGHPAIMRGHGGAVPGFLSEYAYNRELGVGYVMLLNSSHSPRAFARIRNLLATAALEGKALPVPPRVDLPPEELAAFAGYYEYVNPRFALFGFLERVQVGVTIEPDDGLLRATTRGGARFVLVPTGPASFRFPGESGTSVLLRDDGDRRVLEIGLAQLERASAPLADLRYHALRTALLLMFSAVLLAFTWIPGLWILRRRGQTQRPGIVRTTALTRGLPLLAALSFFALEPTLVAGAIAQALGEPSAYAIAFCALTLVFAATSGAALAWAIRGLRSPLRRGVRAHSFIVACACVGMTLYLMHHGIIGLRTWAW